MALQKFLLVVGLLGFATSVHGQEGFISIDCGMTGENSSFYDERVQIYYSSDEKYIDTGINKRVAYNFTKNREPRYEELRSFPSGNRNCYTLHPVTEGKRYLIRGCFHYGNYDGLNYPPEFDLYAGTNHWGRSSQSADYGLCQEIITLASMNFISVCLVKTGNSTPFISVLELRPLDDAMYEAANESQSLVLVRRYDVGTDGELRHPDDPYDRLWFGENDTSTPLSTPSEVEINSSNFKPPSAVMKTASMPIAGQNSLGIEWYDDSNSEFLVVLHFAELEVLGNNQRREISIQSNAGFSHDGLVPSYLNAVTVNSIVPLKGQQEYKVSVSKTESSTLPPILNAYEIYRINRVTQSATNNQDVYAIMDIKKRHQVKRNWMGDPCVPKNYSWEGLECNYDEDSSPRIISLNLSSSGLLGKIDDSFGRLQAIESLDLSNNNLTGGVPTFLEDLRRLKFLNISSNLLEGTIPKALLDRSDNRSLNMSYDHNPNLCVSESCQRKRKNILLVIIAPSVCAAVVLLLMGVIIRWRRRRGQSVTFLELDRFEIAASRNTGNTNQTYGLTHQTNSVTESLQFDFGIIAAATDNFSNANKLGEGGFGSVYKGRLSDEQEIAVKRLSRNSGQGTQEFKNEVELVAKLQHRNLVKLMGFCLEGEEKILIYEYVPNTSLDNFLFDANKRAALDWERRYKIIRGISRGLLYLHEDSRLRVVHRDLKASNILLDREMNPKISDFGMARLFGVDQKQGSTNRIVGT